MSDEQGGSVRGQMLRPPRSVSTAARVQVGGESFWLVRPFWFWVGAIALVMSALRTVMFITGLITGVPS